MKSFAVLSLLAATTLAQSTTASSGPSVPDGLSDGCRAYVEKFDSDSTLTTCTKALIQATKNFAPGSSGSTTPAQISGAVDDICTGSVATACPDSLIRTQLGDFYAACSDELTAKPVDALRKIYDVLYALPPMKQAICSKDDQGNYCLVSGDDGIKAALSAGGSFNPSSIVNSLSSNGAVNPDAYRTNNVPFFFRQPSMDEAALCTPCTRSILTSYFNFESDVLYASGISSSGLLGGQNDLVGAIQQKCGANFLNGAVQAAGGIKSGSFSSGAVKGVSDRFASLVAIAAGGLTLAVPALL